MGAIAELPGDSSVGVRPSPRWLRSSARRGLIDALVTQPPPATTTVLPRTTTVLPRTTTVVLPRTTSGGGTDPIEVAQRALRGHDIFGEPQDGVSFAKTRTPP